MALTKVSGSVLKDPLSLGGEVSIGGTLTYQDVTNVDAIGIITARAGVNVSAGEIVVGSNIKIGNAGIITASGLDISGDIDVDGHTNLDNVSIAGVTTFTGAIDANGDLDVDGHTNLDNVSIAGIVTAQQIRYSSGSGNWNGNPRSVVLGYSGTEYAQLGMGWIPTGTNGQHTSNNTDLQSRLQLQDGLQIYGSGAPVASGQTVSWKTVADFKPSAIKLYTSGNSNSEKLRITSTGLVGINESSPGTHLHVNSGTYNGSATFESTDEYAHILIKDNSTHANGTYFGVQANEFRFANHDGSTSAERFRVKTDGIKITTQNSHSTAIQMYNTTSSSNVWYVNGEGDYFTGNSYPRDDANKDLGFRSGYRWRDLILSGGVQLGGTGTANYLDDYEYGNWNSTVQWQNGNTTGGYNNTTTVAGTYVKVGTVVHAWIQVYPNSYNGGSDCVITGITLPFAVGTTGGVAMAAYSGQGNYGAWLSVTTYPRTYAVLDSSANKITPLVTGNGQGAGFWGHKSGTVAANAQITATYYSA